MSGRGFLRRLFRGNPPAPNWYPVRALLNFADETGAIQLAPHEVRLPADAALHGARRYLPLDAPDGSLALVSHHNAGYWADRYRKVRGEWLLIAPLV